MGVLKAFASALRTRLPLHSVTLWKHVMVPGIMWLGMTAGSGNSADNHKAPLARLNRHGSTYVSSPRVSAARKGKALAIWSEGAYGSRSLCFSSCDARYAWTSGSAAGTGTGDEGDAKAALNDQGSGMVVWLRSNRAAREVLAAAYDPASGWHAPAVLDASGAAFAPDVTIDEEGNAIAVWSRRNPDGCSYSCLAARHTREGWGGNHLLSSGATSAKASLSGNASGKALVIWSQADVKSGGMELRHNSWVSEFDPAKGWRPAVPVGHEVVAREGTQEAAASLAGHYDPLVALDEAGNAVALWQEVDSTDALPHLQANRLDARKGWGLPHTLCENPLSFSLAVGTGGSAYVCWTQSEVMAEVPFYVTSLSVATLLPEQVWLTEKVLPAHPYFCSSPTITVRHDDLLLTWLNSSGSSQGQLWSVRGKPQSGWEAPTPLEGAEAVTEYAAAESESGEAILLWAEGGANAAVKSMRV